MNRMDLSNYYNGFQSERFFYRKLTENDIESWLDFYKNNPNLKYLNINLNRTDKAMVKAWIDIQMERYTNNAFGQLGIISRMTSELVGTIGFFKSTYCKAEEIEKATAIKPAYWKQGIGKESSITFINAVFENNFAEAIIAMRHVENTAFVRFSQSLGFQDAQIISQDNRVAVKQRLTKVGWKQNSISFYPKV